MTFLIASIIVLLTFVAGALLAWAFIGIDKAVITTKEDIENNEKAYNPALTLGFRINSQTASNEQVKEARLLSAQKAAAMPRGANMKIGWRESEADLKLKTASDGVDEDPWTASKIAQYHGWDGAKTGIPAGGVPEAGAIAAPVAAPAAGGKIKLVPGKDYPVIEITDDMPPEEIRKTRIANAKAKSAAIKQAKAAGITAPVAAAAAPAAQTQAPAAPDPVAVGIEPPKLIEITDDMPPDEIRKARIANSKAKSAFNKSLKAAGIDPKSVEIDEQGNIVMPEGAPPPAAAAQSTPAPAAAPQQASGPVDLASLGISPPQLVAITDGMEPDEIRKARISNSKARSAFNKSLKAAGIDPKTVEIDESGNVVMPQKAAAASSAPAASPTASPQPAEASPPQQSDGEVDLAALGIEKPQLIELTDDLSPDEKRQARISNSKARSAFNRALKAAGIDPKSVEI